MLDMQNIIQEFLTYPERFSEDEHYIIAFVHLYQSQPQLFSSVKDSVAKLCDNLPDDLENISEAILEWCQDGDRNIYGEFLKILPNNTKAPGGKKNLNVEQAKELIEQGVRNSIPSKQTNEQNKPSS
ncbi:hypothetical protein ACE1CI_01565 [Aerosakkonemataceae cyanobacterium BLCC-F50]|uniref:Uncharacterized protein n=1 Tax=Floridaenema flaviceps BLCC-F50 TaxID=3153642 RepID=A0ABV4XIR2_9CYAN